MILLLGPVNNPPIKEEDQKGIKFHKQAKLLIYHHQTKQILRIYPKPKEPKAIKIIKDPLLAKRLAKGKLTRQRKRNRSKMIIIKNPKAMAHPKDWQVPPKEQEIQRKQKVQAKQQVDLVLLQKPQGLEEGGGLGDPKDQAALEALEVLVDL